MFSAQKFVSEGKKSNKKKKRKKEMEMKANQQVFV